MIDEISREIATLTKRWNLSEPMDLTVENVDSGCFRLVVTGRRTRWSASVDLDGILYDRAPVVTLRQALAQLEAEMVQGGKLPDPRGPGPRKYRVIERISSGSGKQWNARETHVLWEGSDPRSFHGKFGQIGGAFMRKVENILQIWMVNADTGGGRWEDVDPKRAISRFKNRHSGQNPGHISPRRAVALKEDTRYQALPPSRTLSPEERKKQDLQTASPHGRYVKSWDDKKAFLDLIGDRSAAEEHRRRTMSEEAKQEEARKLREKEEARKEDERRAEIRKFVRGTFGNAQALLDNIVDAWVHSAVAEADAREAQVEDELFGGGGEGLKTSMIWSGAENAALKLLEFAQARVDEARARRAGQARAFVEEAEEDEDALKAYAANHGTAEHVSEAEFQQVATEAALSPSAPEDESLADTDSDEMDALVSDVEMDQIQDATVRAG